MLLNLISRMFGQKSIVLLALIRLNRLKGLQTLESIPWQPEKKVWRYPLVHQITKINNPIQFKQMLRDLPQTVFVTTPQL